MLVAAAKGLSGKGFASDRRVQKYPNGYHGEIIRERWGWLQGTQGRHDGECWSDATRVGPLVGGESRRYGTAMSDSPPAVPVVKSRRKETLIAAALLAGLIAGFFGRSIGYGLVLDDYNHRAELRAVDGSFRSLVEASHLGDPQRRVRMWWQDDADLYFFRPLAFLLMRATYVLGGWRPEVMHAASLGWFFAGAMLVYALTRRATGAFGWALLAAVVFVLHPNNFMAPRWIACQNELMATAFVLAGLLAYGWFSDWWSGRSAAHRGPTRWVWFALAMLCLAAALGCRESAVVLLPLVMLGDWACGCRIVGVREGILKPAVTEPGAQSDGSDTTAACWSGRPTVCPDTLQPHRRDAGATWVSGRILVAYALMVATIAAYLVLRHAMLGPLTIPQKPYAYPPGEPGFVAFVAGKLGYYLLGLWACVPIVGFSGQEQLRSHPALFAGAVAVILALWAVLLVRFRGRRRIWLWLGLATLPLTPVLPVFASSHHLYLPIAGVGIAVALVGSWLAEGVRQGSRRRLRVCQAGLATAIAMVLAAFAGAAVVIDQAVEGLSASGQLTIRQVLHFGGPFAPGDKLFFINLPMLAFNCMPAIEEARDVAPLEGYVLTFAPAFLGMARPGRLEQLDDHRLRVSLDGPGYFSGLIGRSILQGIGRDRPWAVGTTFSTAEFTVIVADADATGVQAFIFSFRRPLRDPSYHFFFGSPTFDAYPVQVR